MSQDTARKRVVVVGASTGLGRCIGIGLAQRGEQVTLLARRLEKIQEAAQEAGNDAIAIQCDVIDQAAAKTALDEAAEAMGGIDTVIYAAAVGPIVRVSDATPEQWLSTFSTNVVGASNVSQAALPHLKKSAGNVIYLSTTGASVHGAVGRAERLPGDQSGAQPSRRPLADRAARHQLHRRHDR